MESYRVMPAGTHEILVGSGIAFRLPELLAAGSRPVGAPGRIALLTDRTVAGLYLARCQKAFADAGLDVRPIAIDGQENGKTLDAVRSVFEQMEDMSFGDSDRLVALGGGVVCDVAGFAAAGYRGGCPHVILPTTLLSMVDSSMGGRCQLNFRGHKNLLSLPSAPALAVVDPSFLQTLPKRHLAAAMSEIAKFALLDDPSLLDLLEKVPFPAEEVIVRALAARARLLGAASGVPHEDSPLSLGHAVGHSIESHFRFLRFLHGEAVALGLLAVCSSPGLRDLFGRLGLPVQLDGVTAETLVRRILRDYPGHAGTLRMVLLDRPGSYRVETVAAPQAEGFLSALLARIL